MLRFHKMKQTELSQHDWTQEPLSALLPEGADYLAQKLAAGDTLFVMYDGEKPVGLLEMDAAPVGEKPKCARVGLVVLLPEYRRHGLGRMLMCLAAGEAVERQLLPAPFRRRRRRRALQRQSTCSRPDGFPICRCLISLT